MDKLKGEQLTFVPLKLDQVAEFLGCSKWGWGGTRLPVSLATAIGQRNTSKWKPLAAGRLKMNVGGAVAGEASK